MKVGDYVRYKNFSYDNIVYIGKITYCKVGYEIDGRMTSSIKLMKEPSPNIIDLIEVGDYVDKLRVVDKKEDYIVVETFDERIVICKDDTIKSIVTKEQFKSMEYKL